MYRPDAALYVHRLSVRRQFDGGQLSSTLIHHAKDRARSMGRKYLRLDCDSSRRRLRELYLSLGFRHHSDHVAGSFPVTRFEKASRLTEYDLKVLGRATIVGETTGGGAHPTQMRRIDDHFRGRSRGPRTSSERVGV
jgi:Acetyltransferase (GNAT) family